MTMISAQEIIANLREKKKILEDQIEAAIKECHKMNTIDTEHKADELAKLLKQILSILRGEK